MAEIRVCGYRIDFAPLMGAAKVDEPFVVNDDTLATLSWDSGTKLTIHRKIGPRVVVCKGFVALAVYKGEENIFSVYQSAE